MTSAFGGQRSIQLSYGCNLGRGLTLAGLAGKALLGRKLCRALRDRRPAKSREWVNGLGIGLFFIAVREPCPPVGQPGHNISGYLIAG